MKVTGVATTSPQIQMRALDKSTTRVKLNLARTTDSLEVQKAIMKEGEIRVLLALATNKNLYTEIEENLVDIGNSRITEALLSRTE